jgi:hypothetical protein
MTQPYWADNDPKEAGAWNTCVLGPVALPGICAVTAEKGRATDKKTAKGQDGHGTTDTGATPGKVTIDVVLATREHWIAWQKVRPLIDPNQPGAKRTPLEIKHPAAADRGIKDVYVTNIKADPPSARAGMKIQIECDEWTPKPKTSKGADKSSAAKPVKNSFVSQLPGGTAAGQSFVNSLTRERTPKEIEEEDRKAFREAMKGNF